MLIVTISGVEHFDDEKQVFVEVGAAQIVLEHSLVSLSKWEQKFEKPYLAKTEKTNEEAFEYIKCMILSPYVEADLHRLNAENIDAITEYINRKNTATWFNELVPEAASKETITAELVYYWMTELKIDWEAQYWHLNNLFTLIKIFGVKNSKPKPLNAQEAAARRRELNKQRREAEGHDG